jgi:hypothetical protein
MEKDWNPQIKAALILILVAALLMCWWFDFP